MNNPIYIVGGGNSLRRFDFSKLKNKTTIVVNKAILYVPNSTYFITMDFTFLKKISNFKTNATKIFIANFARPYIQERKGQIVDTRYNMIYTLHDFDMIIKSYKEKGMGFTFNDFRNGINSGYCALQFAVLMRYNPIYLLGIDLKALDDTHFHGGYGESQTIFKKKLDTYSAYFIKGLEKIKENSNIVVYNCSKQSKLNKILPYKEI